MKESDATVLARIREIAEGAASAFGLELVLAELGWAGGRAIVRLTIDRSGGVTLEDCAALSRRVGAALEAEDPIPGSYQLEVSSPGLDRRLVKESDYARFEGRRARISLSTPREGRRHFEGLLRGFEQGEVLMEIEGGGMVRLSPGEIEKARLVPEF